MELRLRGGVGKAGGDFSIPAVIGSPQAQQLNYTSPCRWIEVDRSLYFGAACSLPVRELAVPVHGYRKSDRMDGQGMRVTINGKFREVPAGASIADVLKNLGLRDERVVVERNREIVARASYPQVCLRDDDALEIVHFVGGG